EHYPSGTSGEGVAHRHELAAPAVHRAEVARERFGHRLGWLAVAAQAREVELVEQGGIERDELLALQAVDEVARRLAEVERLELARDGVQPPQRAAVVILVVALDQLGRQPEQGPRTAGDRFQRVAHTVFSFQSVRRTNAPPRRSSARS